MHTLSRRNAIRFALLVAAVPLVTSLPAVAADVPLAIKGYDPVAYFTDGKPTQGLPEFTYQWDEHRYQFASAQHRDMFKADPVRYAPQFAHSAKQPDRTPTRRWHALNRLTALARENYLL